VTTASTSDGADRVAIVTGGASGIGLAISERLAEDGLAVAILDRDGDAAAAAAAKLAGGGATAIGLTADVTDRAQIEAAVARVREQLSAATVLVNSAGLDGFDRFLDITPDLWHRIIEVNLTGTFNCCQAVVPDMIEAGWGRIVTISSSSAQSGTKRMAHYVASKGGVIALTKALALDLAPHGITVNTIPPGAIDTPMMRRPIESGAMGSMDQIVARAPLGRLGTPEDIAAAAAFLCSEDAGYITGQQINVNGAWYL
jgi:NAD(P)-dependent dehydrogenase (short-subunit alcohol dehydrogenase family)